MKKLSMEELGRISVDAFKLAGKLPVTIVLDNIRSLHNVGASFRTADAFRFEKIFLTGITGTPPHREIEKTALGATASVEWQYVEKVADVITSLKKENYSIVAVEQTTKSQSLHTFPVKTNGKYCLIFGNEVHGVSDEALALTEHALEIPQAGTKHSLNISVCLGIVAWEFFSKMRLSQEGTARPSS